MILTLYRIATTLGGPVIQFYLKRRIAEGKEEPSRFPERKGTSAQIRPKGPLIWLHAASVGESISMIPLINSLLQVETRLHVLMTTGTVSSAALMAERLPQRAFHQYVPVDRMAYVQRFLDHWNPDLTLWAESEFWPNLILETQRRKIPMILVNGRISKKSFDSWRRFPSVIRQLLRGFTLCLGQTEEDTDRLKLLGAPNYQYLGNLKFAVPPLPADLEEVIRLEQQISKRPRWLAASTHSGEEKIIGSIHKKLSASYPGLLTIIVPRHPGRGDEIANFLATNGLSISQRSKQEPINSETHIYVADTLGELGLFFRLSEIAFIGKSLVPLGGQNPLEAVCLGCAVIHGPHMTNFQKITEDLARTGSAISVTDEVSLAAAVDCLLGDEEKRRFLKGNGRKYMDSQGKVIDNVSREIITIFKQRTGGKYSYEAT